MQNCEAIVHIHEDLMWSGNATFTSDKDDVGNLFIENRLRNQE